MEPQELEKGKGKNFRCPLQTMVFDRSQTDRCRKTDLRFSKDNHLSRGVAPQGICKAPGELKASGLGFSSRSHRQQEPQTYLFRVCPR